MSMREEIEKYTKLTGEDGWHVPIMQLGAYLDGYDKGLEVLDKIRAEIRKEAFTDVNNSKFIFVNHVEQIINKYKAESEDKE